MNVKRALLISSIGLLVTSTVVIAQGAPTYGAASLTVDQQVHLADESHIFHGGDPFLWADVANGNLALGTRALSSNTIGTGNLAVGKEALYYNTEGTDNVAVGDHALENNETGRFNTAVGVRSLRYNTGGSYNSAFGYNALAGNDEGSNSAFGWSALASNTSGYRNSAFGDSAVSSNYYGANNVGVGFRALSSSTFGSYNIGLGSYAGNILGSGVITPTTTMSHNIFIANSGQTDEAHVIRIGTAFDDQMDVDPANDTGQIATYVAGIDNQTLTVSANPVCVESDGQLGLCNLPSSRHYKHDIQGMGAGTERLMQLRPVTFHFREEIAGEEEALQFGLIAEEVAELFPEIVEFDEEGRPEAVKYQFLSSILLNELQKQQRGIEEQAMEIRRLTARLDRLESTDPP